MKRLPWFYLAVAVSLVMFVMTSTLAMAFTVSVNTSPPAGTISNSTSENVQITATNEGTAVNDGTTIPNLAIDNVKFTVDKVMTQGANAVQIVDLATFVNSMATNGATTNGATFVSISANTTQANTQARTLIGVNGKTASTVFTANLTIDTAKTATGANNTSDSIKNPADNSKASDVISATVRTNSAMMTTVLAGNTSYYTVNFSSDGTCVSSGECVAIVTANLKVPINSAANNTFTVTDLYVVDQEGRAYANELVGVASEGNITLVDAIADTATGRAPSTYNAGTFAYDTTAAGLVALNFA